MLFSNEMESSGDDFRHFIVRLISLRLWWPTLLSEKTKRFAKRERKQR